MEPQVIIVLVGCNLDEVMNPRRGLSLEHLGPFRCLVGSVSDKQPSKEA